MEPAIEQDKWGQANAKQLAVECECSALSGSLFFIFMSAARSIKPGAATRNKNKDKRQESRQDGAAWILNPHTVKD